MRRRTILPPIRPSPIIPSCIVLLCLCSQRSFFLIPSVARNPYPLIHRGYSDPSPSVRDCRKNSLLETLQPRLYILWQMHSQRTPFAIGQYLKVSPSLSRLYGSECVLLSWHRQINSIVARDLQEHASVRTAFVGLSSGMQETRAKAQAGCNVLAITHSMAHGLQ